MYEVLYRGFDKLDVAFQGALRRDLVERLEAAKTRAQAEMRPVLVEYRMARFLVAETGAPHGYAFRCDTGDDGEIWFFKRNATFSDWNLRVSVKSMALALCGLNAVRVHLYDFLAIIADHVGAESIGRVDYAVDVLAPKFILVPDQFVMHSHTDRRDYIEAGELQISGKSNKVTSVTIGHMPRRQVIVYDKRAEVIQKKKLYWWEIWNASRRRQGKSDLDSKDRENSAVWRIELRAGKDHLKDRWGIRTWRDLYDKAGDLFHVTRNAIRYTAPASDLNRSRWPNHELWDLLGRELSSDLFEMTSGADPSHVKTVYRNHLRDTLEALIIGSAATYSIACGLDHNELHTLPNRLAQSLNQYMKNQRKRFDEKRSRAAERYYFSDRGIRNPMRD